MTALLERVDPLPRAPAASHLGDKRFDARFPRRSVVALLLAAAVANAVVGFGVELPIVRPVVGLVALTLVPGIVLAQAFGTRGVRSVERVLFVAGGLVLGVLVVGLTLNYVGFRLGVLEPLAAGPMALVSFVVDAVLLVVRARSIAAPSLRPVARWMVRPLGRRHAPAVVAAVSVPVAVAGAVRLNNGAGSGVAFVGLALAVLALAWAAVARKGRRTSDAVTIFGSSAALLLATSLRSWFVIGHDVLREYAFFELTFRSSHWDIGGFPDPYNACLSVTVLPTVLARFTGLPGSFVFKCLLQLVFALVPVATYLFARRLLSRRLAIAAVSIVVAFPTFWADMPFLVRQEVAFLFLALVLLAATRPGWSRRSRAGLATAMAVGLVLSHYSTTYILIITLGVALAALWVRRAVHRLRGTRTSEPPMVLVSLPMLGVVAAMTFVWTVPVTHTGGHFAQVVKDSVGSLMHPGAASQSSDLRYALLPFGGTSEQHRLDSYTKSTLRETRRAREQGVFVPFEKRDRPTVGTEASPTTPLGATLARATGANIHRLDGVVENVVARLLQVLLLAGVWALVRRRRETKRFSREATFLVLGAVGALAVEVLLPGLSVEYGVLRAFEQGLLIFAPVVIVGALFLFAWLGDRARPAALAFIVAALAVLTGATAHVLGGYPEQLHLANRGPYFDAYYRTGQDHAAATWVLARLDGRRHDGVRSLSTDRSTLADLVGQRGSSIPRTDDSIYPTLVRKRAAVLMRSTTVSTGLSQILIGGDLISYRYPMSLLERTKDRLYDNGSVRVYR